MTHPVHITDDRSTGLGSDVSGILGSDLGSGVSTAKKRSLERPWERSVQERTKHHRGREGLRKVITETHVGLMYALVSTVEERGQ